MNNPLTGLVTQRATPASASEVPKPTGPVTTRGFADVTSTAPLRIQRIGDDHPYEEDPINLAPAVEIGDLVRFERDDGQLIILGRVHNS
ncbi:hypothetical protein [Micrococcus sp. IITD107]|uniref:hypothetical protein n=1 Tax=Micrococcus sp. IITD107 TaxID=3342790 RepID=UPI0035B909B0